MNFLRYSNPIRTSAWPHQGGSSLLEVLVAILLISVGLLGIAGLSSATFSYNKAAQLRLTGLALVNDYADRARVNVYGYDLEAYDIGLSDTKPSAITLTGAAQPNPLTAAQNVAQFDRRAFMTSVENRLPQGRAVVESNPSLNARDLDVWLLWKEPQADAADSLFTAGQENCPNDLGTDDKAAYSCMYFKVGL